MIHHDAHKMNLAFLHKCKFTFGYDILLEALESLRWDWETIDEDRMHCIHTTSLTWRPPRRAD